MSVCLLSAEAGCGRKMPPIQPGVYPPPTVTDLVCEVDDSDIVLSWSIPPVKGEQQASAASFKIFRAHQTAADAECSSCPVRFQMIGEVLTVKGQSPIRRMRFRDKLEPGLIYRYKVNASSRDGVEGKDSNMVVLTH